jgi:2-polyprenyl-3-methyl-5-hydroxy-6-metoxy-1,4-benzoquinol methylase
VIFVTSFNKTAWSYMTKVFGEQVFRVVPSGTHTWSMLVRPKTVWQTLEKYGCEKACVCGFEYDMLKSEWKLCRNTWSSYALHMVKRPNPVVYYHTIEY